MKRLILYIFIVCLAGQVCAQQRNLPQYEQSKRVRFGFILGTGSYDFKLSTSDEFKKMDSLKSIDVRRFPGLTLGGTMCYKFQIPRITEEEILEIRFSPSLSLSQRNLLYNFTNSASNQVVEIESVCTEFPLGLRYKSGRRGNIAFFVSAGAKYSYDFSSDINTTRSNSKPIVALYPNTFSYDLGVGVNMYLPYFVLSPELKLTGSFKNVMAKDEFIYSRALEGLWNRIVSFTFYFE